MSQMPRLCALTSLYQAAYREGRKDTGARCHLSGSQSQPAAYHQQQVLLRGRKPRTQSTTWQPVSSSQGHQADNCWHNGPEERCSQPVKHPATEDETTGESSYGRDVVCTSLSLAPSSATRQRHQIGLQMRTFISRTTQRINHHRPL
ncbi:hypothetical protein H112_02505 [Trichophyton rubrum D6]|uniref:Uncharacterized protein n=3 Tax=Trichophyton TaxID=5550 RepID=F2SUW9_TRIRC|nr:uncharacterized protein TERG_06266 [Trichophyton rubrum CBS 118892]EZF25159.1 hypothetical protein H100_02506 [Trichophyton rubrum MR850]EZF44190.1 hypothetical protein H102_02500 [Trichophyton rubrum CBS 100081]EZF54842.1 hypothetical protein H103_02513 [Trichophyton rubrum CBS 288.86]EZF65451.1 hypothetical protein H104_02491 [Trichophyton rubrum CBS 289.86]EZF76079.1 hypothetical protein H105_02518 [Trichophyton soudanense CBS 452.61]EZF86750.1 hypothetical protein H110_02510 [Trichophy